MNWQTFPYPVDGPSNIVPANPTAKRLHARSKRPDAATLARYRERLLSREITRAVMAAELGVCEAITWRWIAALGVPRGRPRKRHA